MTDIDHDIAEAARIGALHCGRGHAEANDFRAVAKAYATRLAEVAALAHDGGLRGMSEADALSAIRRLTLPHWNKTGSNEERAARLTDGAPAVPCGQCGATDRHYSGCTFAYQRVTVSAPAVPIRRDDLPHKGCTFSPFPDDPPDEWPSEYVAKADFDVIARKAARYDWLIEQTGSFQDGSDSPVSLLSDDATRERHLYVGGKRIRTEHTSSFASIIDEQLQRATD